eukprot:scaffold20183_cov26-Prasinocladus_malaysianus.AAC.1
MAPLGCQSCATHQRAAIFAPHVEGPSLQERPVLHVIDNLRDPAVFLQGLGQPVAGNLILGGPGV